MTHDETPRSATQKGILLLYHKATDVEVMIDTDIVEAYQARWPDWRARMVEILRVAAAKL